MGAFGVTPEARDQAIAALRQTLRAYCDEAKADTRARLIESKAFESCANFQEWNQNIERNRQYILIKFQQGNMNAQQHIEAPYAPAPQQPMAHYPPQAQIHPQMQFQQQQQQQQYYQQQLPPQSTMTMPSNNMHQPQMHPASYPPATQQQGWMQASPPYGYQIMPQQQQQMAMDGYNLTPQSTMSTATTWGAPPPQPQQQPLHPLPPLTQNGYAPHFPTAIEPTSGSAVSQPSQVPPDVERQHAFNEFRRLQMLARQTLLSDARKIAAGIASAAAAKGTTGVDQNLRTLKKSIGLIELEDLSRLPHDINPALVSKFASLLEFTKSLIAQVKENHQRKKEALEVAAVEVAAPPPPAAPVAAAPEKKKEKERVAVPKDPTEKLLHMLHPNPIKPSLVFPSAVAAHLKNQLDINQHGFPLPKINF